MNSRCTTKLPKLHSPSMDLDSLLNILSREKNLMAKKFEKCYISLFGFRMDIIMLKPLTNPAVKKSV